MIASRLSGSIFRVLMTYYLDEKIFCRISQVPTADDIAAIKVFKVESEKIIDEIIYESSEISVFQSLFSGEKVEKSLDTSDFIANVKVYNVKYDKLYSNASIYYDKIDSVYYIDFRMGDSDFASFQLSNELVSQIFNLHM